MSPTLIVFWGFAGLAMASALFCITRKNPVASALWLVMTLFSLSALFVILDAQFIAVLQVLVYAGAIMVLFLFVIMLLNLGRRGPADLKGPAGLAVGVALGVVLLFQLLVPARAAEDRARDDARHPVEALTFWGLAPGMTILEVQPGGGWWTDILAPYARMTGGRYFATGTDLGGSLRTPASFCSVTRRTGSISSARRMWSIEANVSADTG